MYLCHTYKYKHKNIMQITLNSLKALIDSGQTPTLQTEEASLVGRTSLGQFSLHKYKHMNANTNIQIQILGDQCSRI